MELVVPCAAAGELTAGAAGAVGVAGAADAGESAIIIKSSSVLTAPVACKLELKIEGRVERVLIGLPRERVGAPRR